MRLSTCILALTFAASAQVLAEVKSSTANLSTLRCWRPNKNVTDERVASLPPLLFRLCFWGFPLAPFLRRSHLEYGTS